jgi:hypothetical protein
VKFKIPGIEQEPSKVYAEMSTSKLEGPSKFDDVPDSEISYVDSVGILQNENIRSRKG